MTNEWPDAEIVYYYDDGGGFASRMPEVGERVPIFQEGDPPTYLGHAVVLSVSPAGAIDLGPPVLENVTVHWFGDEEE